MYRANHYDHYYYHYTRYKLWVEQVDAVAKISSTPLQISTNPLFYYYVQAQNILLFAVVSYGGCFHCFPYLQHSLKFICGCFSWSQCFVTKLWLRYYYCIDVSWIWRKFCSWNEFSTTRSTTSWCLWIMVLLVKSRTMQTCKSYAVIQPIWWKCWIFSLWELLSVWFCLKLAEIIHSSAKRSFSRVSEYYRSH